MSRQTPHSRGARDFSSPQIRVRGTDDFPYHPSRRLRLPNERPPFRTRFGWLLRIVLPLAVMGGIGVGVYFGVSELLEEASDEPPAQEVVVEETPAGSEPDAATGAVDEAAAGDGTTGQPVPTENTETAQAAEALEDGDSGSAPSASAETSTAEPAERTEADQTTARASELAHPALAEPEVSGEAITPAQIDGAPLTAERVTAEPVPEGVPRSLADGSAYDPTEPATAFSGRWPVGTTLRLTRLPGATLLSDEEQADVVGRDVLVVVRGSQDSNTDLQLSPAAFDQVAVYGVERIIAVSVEVTAPPR